MSKREYTHVRLLYPEIKAMIEAGKTQRAQPRPQNHTPGRPEIAERPVFFCPRQKMNDFRALHGQAAGNVIHSVLTRKSACKW